MCSHKLHLKFRLRGGRQRLQRQDPERTVFPGIIHSWENLCPCTEQISSPWLLSFFFFFSFFMLRKLKGMKRIQAEGTLIISPFCKNQKGDCGDQISKISGKHQGEIFSRILPFHLAIACLSDKYARAYFMSGARVFLTPSFQRVCLSLSWNLCSSLYKGPMLLLSKMQT